MAEAIFPKVEIVQYGPVDPELGGHIASALRINGVEFHAPVDSEVVVGFGPDQLTSVTATFFVSEVQVVTHDE